MHKIYISHLINNAFNSVLENFACCLALLIYNFFNSLNYFRTQIQAFGQKIQFDS